MGASHPICAITLARTDSEPRCSTRSYAIRGWRSRTTRSRSIPRRSSTRIFSPIYESAPAVSIAENGNIVIEEGLLFETNSYTIHTDERGTVAYNRERSAKRANAVLNHMFDANASLAESYGSYFASSAYSEFRPVYSKDANVRAMIEEYMHNLNPALVAPPGAPTAAPVAPAPVAP